MFSTNQSAADPSIREVWGMMMLRHESTCFRLWTGNCFVLKHNADWWLSHIFPERNKTFITCLFCHLYNVCVITITHKLKIQKSISLLKAIFKDSLAKNGNSVIINSCSCNSKPACYEYKNLLTALLHKMTVHCCIFIFLCELFL